LAFLRSSFKPGPRRPHPRHAVNRPPPRDPLSSIAARVIGSASRQVPADAALRRELRAHPGLTRDASGWISRAVFAHSRWRGWLPPGRPILDQIPLALELSDRFRANPPGFTDEELRERAVPGWTQEQAEVSASWLRSIQAEPSLWLRAKREHESALRQSLDLLRKSSLPNALAYEGHEDLFRRPEFQSGWFEIQDIASQLVGFLCDPQPGETWWDACAGEGGKTLHLSDLMQNRGLIWSSDRAEWRLKVLRRRAARARCFNYRAAVWHGGQQLPTRTRFDGVLLDAPCSGMGTWRRNPHARWTTEPKDVVELSSIQLRLLAHAAPAVKRGGRLIYAVCTIAREETFEVARRFEAEHPDFEPAPMRSPWPDHAGSAQHTFRSPQTGGNDMFVAAWRRI